VSAEYRAPYTFSGGSVVKVVFDVSDDAYLDEERHMATARD
jgi:arylsulfatase